MNDERTTYVQIIAYALGIKLNVKTIFLLYFDVSFAYWDT